MEIYSQTSATFKSTPSAWCAKKKIFSLWNTASTKESIPREACPLLVQSIDDQYIIVDGNKVHAQSLQQIILELESRLAVDRLVDEIPDVLDIGRSNGSILLLCS